MSDLNRRAFLTATAALGISMPVGVEAAVAERSERMSTGLRLLDFPLRGGWVKGAINTVLIPLGEGQSSLADTVAWAAHREGHRVTLATPCTTTQPLRLRRYYTPVGRKTFSLKELPAGALPIYDKVVGEEGENILAVTKPHRVRVPQLPRDVNVVDTNSMRDVESAIPTSDLVVYSGVVFPWDDFNGILTAARIHRTTVVFVTQAPRAGVTSGNTDLVRMSSLVVALPEGFKGLPRDGAVRITGPCEIIKSRD